MVLPWLVAFKPTSSILIPGKTIDRDGNEVDLITKGRHDPCVGLRAVPIVEAMMALTLCDHLLRQRAMGIIELFVWTSVVGFIVFFVIYFVAVRWILRIILTTTVKSKSKQSKLHFLLSVILLSLPFIYIAIS